MSSAGEELLAFQIKATGLPAPEREVSFHPARRWRLDFAWKARWLACEVEGGVFAQGRHSRGASFTADCVKYAELAIAGWRLIRVTTAQVKSGEAIAWLERALTA